MRQISDIIQGADTIAIGGHIRPDGDCVGACLGLYNYIKDNYPEKKVTLYLQEISDKFKFLARAEEIVSEAEKDEVYDLFLIMDSSDVQRLGEFEKYYHNAKRTCCIDHHISNEKFADDNVIDAEASSTCEVLYELLEEEKLNKGIAEALYMGIVHDSGVFKYPSTSARTMEIAGKLMSMGIDFTKIIDDTFYTRTYAENQIMGRAIMESIMFLDGKCIVTAIRKETQDFYNISDREMGGIVEQLRVTKGVECAIFMYETEPLKYKVSMRSKNLVDVSKIATYFGGGGHVRAAGCNLEGTFHDVINNISEQIALQLV